jgi:predicted acylesterase/phospholipase RssA
VSESDLAPGILTGVSAGGIIATCLASRAGRFSDSVAKLHELWRNPRIDDVFPVDRSAITNGQSL